MDLRVHQTFLFHGLICNKLIVFIIYKERGVFVRLEVLSRDPKYLNINHWIQNFRNANIVFIKTSF